MLQSYADPPSRVGACVACGGHSAARLKAHLRDEVDAFDRFPETGDPAYVGHGSQASELDSLVRARRQEEAREILTDESTSPFAKKLLLESQRDFEAHVISYQDFRVRMVTLAELGQPTASGDAANELWELHLHFRDVRASKERTFFLDETCEVGFDGWWPWHAFRPQRTRVSSQGELEVLDAKGGVLHSINSLARCSLKHEKGFVRVSTPGEPDLLLRSLVSGYPVMDDVPLDTPVPKGQLASGPAANESPLIAAQATQEADAWRLVCPTSYIDYHDQCLYRMLRFARKGFEVASPTLLKYTRGHDGRDSAATKRLHDQDRYERFRQKVNSLHGIAHNQLCKAAPRAFASKFLTWCFENHLPNVLMRFSASVDDPSPLFPGAEDREKRKRLVEREALLRQIEQKVMCPSAIQELTAATPANTAGG